MQLKPFEFSIVVLAKNHNPSLVTHDFLKSNDIVPEGYSVAEGGAISTPVASQIRYNQRVLILADQERAMFMEQTTALEGGLESSSLACPGISTRFIDKLPHVNYTAIGINQKIYVPSEGRNPQEVISDVLVKEGGWKSFQKSQPQAQVTFTYPYDEKKLTLTISEVHLEFGLMPIQKAFGFQANFHYDIGGERQEKIKVAKRIIGEYKKDLDLLNDFLTRNFVEEFSS